jgi:D-ribose pyranase
VRRHHLLLSLQDSRLMKKFGTLNTRLSSVIASLGHTDRLVICDSGLPIPNGKEVVDLALTCNIPRLVDTVRVVLEELEVEGAVVAEEMGVRSRGVYEALMALMPGVDVQEVSHEDFKRMTCENGNIAFVRTGEATPFANVILISGVTFS